MCDKQVSEWIRFGVGSWTKFQLPISDPIDGSMFEPLVQWKPSFRAVFYGRVVESPGECMLVVGWVSSQAYRNFKNSPKFQELMDNLGNKSEHGNAPLTHITIWWNAMFWNGFGPNTEIVTAYVPTSTSQEHLKEATKITRLAHTSAHGRLASLAYRRGPHFAWIDGTQTWAGGAVFACVWCNNWKDKESEERLKATEKRQDPDGGPDRLLAVDVFEKDLKRLGFLGSQSYHVDLIRILRY